MMGETFVWVSGLRERIGEEKELDTHLRGYDDSCVGRYMMTLQDDEAIVDFTHDCVEIVEIGQRVVA